MKLPDRADEFAKTRPAKKSIDEQGGEKISEYDPGRGGWSIPQIERFVSPEVNDDECGREPLGTQCPRPGKIGGQNSPAQIAHESEGAGHAEEVAHGKQADDGKRPPMRPRQDPGEVDGADLRAKQSVEDDQRGKCEQHDLQAAAEIPHAQDRAEEGKAKEIEGLGNF